MNSTLTKIFYFFKIIDRKKLIIIMSCIAGMGLVEMAGVAIILPFLAVVAKPSVIQSNSYLAAVYHGLGFTDTKMFMLFLGASVFAVLVIGNIFSALTAWFSMRFCYFQGKKISCELFKKYVSQPYVFFLNRHSSDLAKNIIVETDRLIVGLFINSINSLTKGVMMVCVFGLLVVVEPLLALTAIAILGGAYLLIYKMIRLKLTRAGRLASALSTVRFQIIDAVIGSIKELKVLGREDKFQEEFADSAMNYAKAETLGQLSPLVTRYLIEAIAFGGMVLIVLYLISANEDISKFLPLLGLYALAGYRLMPAMQQLFAGISAVRYHMAALEVVYDEMQLPTFQSSSRTQKMHLQQSIQLQDLSYQYPGADKCALRQVDLNIQPYTTVGIVGSSGAGKTTLVDVILGLLTPTQGQLKVDGTVISQDNMRAWQDNIGYVPQNIFLIDDTIANNIALGIKGEAINFDAVQKAAKLANLHDFICQELPKGYDTTIGEAGVRLSGGQRQRIGIARALYHEPELLIFDEATSALDGITEKVIMEAIKSLSHRKTIILIAHRLNTVKNCDLVYVLNKGEIIGQGTYQELIESNSTFQHLASAHV